MAGPEDTLLVEPPTPGGTVEAALDGGVLHPVTGPLAVHGEGSHWLAVVTRGATGLRSGIRWIHVIVDATPPAVTLDVQPQPVSTLGTAWVPRGTEISISATDDLSGLANITLQAGGRERTSSSSPLAVTLNTEGVVTISGTARDRAGNVSAPVTRRLSVDGTPPRLSLTLEPAVKAHDGSTIGNPHATIAVKANDSGSGLGPLSYELDGQSLEASRLSGPWSEGVHSLAVTAADRVGNRKTRTLHFVIDATPPAMHCTPQAHGTVGHGGTAWYRPDTSVTCSATDAVAGVAHFAWRVDDAAWNPVTGPIKLVTGTFQTRSIDRAGNEATQTWTFPVDGAPPRITALAPSGRRVKPGHILAVPLDTPVHLLVQDDGSGVASARFQVNEGTWAPLPDHIVFRNGQTFSLAVRACDRLENCTIQRWPVHIVRRSARR